MGHTQGKTLKESIPNLMTENVFGLTITLHCKLHVRILFRRRCDNNDITVFLMG